MDIKELYTRLLRRKQASSVDHTAYWQERVRQHGRRAVLNLAHDDSEYDKVTERQRRILLPLFTSMLIGTERTLLDFGCGPGRFTAALARAIGGVAVGVDISPELLAMTPASENVSYRLITEGSLPKDHFRFDAIWVCLVLGGIPDAKIESAAADINDALNPGGLLFLVENTSSKPDGTYWFFRSQDRYRALFPTVYLQPLTSYWDAGEEISVLAGRKLAC